MSKRSLTFSRRCLNRDPRRVGAVVSIAAVVIAFVAATFAGVQALNARWARMADNEGTIVEWAPAEWVAADTIEIRSNGPDVALRVWARFNAEGAQDVCTARRLRPGRSLQFTIPGLQVSWDYHEAQAPAPGEQSNDLTAFSYGGLLTWRNRYGRRVSLPIEGYMRRRVRLDADPYPHEAPETKPR
jgi:hypothetical protein